MANVKLVEEKDASPKVREIYQDVMKVLNVPLPLISSGQWGIIRNT
jgi:hypothetical protein